MYVVRVNIYFIAKYYEFHSLSSKKLNIFHLVSVHFYHKSKIYVNRCWCNNIISWCTYDGIARAKYSSRSFTTRFYILSSLALTPVAASDSIIITVRTMVGCQKSKYFHRLSFFLNGNAAVASRPVETFAASLCHFYDRNKYAYVLRCKI